MRGVHLAVLSVGLVGCAPSLARESPPREQTSQQVGADERRTRVGQGTEAETTASGCASIDTTNIAIEGVLAELTGPSGWPAGIRYESSDAVRVEAIRARLQADGAIDALCIEAIERLRWDDTYRADLVVRVRRAPAAAVRLPLRVEYDPGRRRAYPRERMRADSPFGSEPGDWHPQRAELASGLALVELERWLAAHPEIVSLALGPEHDSGSADHFYDTPSPAYEAYVVRRQNRQEQACVRARAGSAQAVCVPLGAAAGPSPTIVRTGWHEADGAVAVSVWRDGARLMVVAAGTPHADSPQEDEDSIRFGTLPDEVITATRPEADEGLPVVRGRVGDLELLCFHDGRWRCAEPRRGAGWHDRDTYRRAFAFGRYIATEHDRAVFGNGIEASSGGTTILEIYRLDGEHLEPVGAVVVASWTAESFPSYGGRQLRRRTAHDSCSFRVEPDGDSLRFAREGRSRRRGRIVQALAPFELSDPDASVAYVPDLAGLWTFDAEAGFRRVDGRRVAREL